MRALLIALAVLPAPAVASEAFLADLDRRLRTGGVETVNAYLGARASDMRALHQSAADCVPQAVELTAKLSRGGNSNVAKLHNESLRIAAGGCAEFVLSRLSLNEVPKICGSVSSWTVTQMARELRRRIKEIEADERLRASEHGKACSAAYLFELQNTRVGIKAHPPSSRSR
jgi:hypothetical protein